LKKAILESEVQRYISANENSNPNDLVLKGIPFEQELHAVILDQIKAKKKIREKLPSWHGSAGIYYPPPVHLEQSSSEQTARYKAELIDGKTLIDITGGFGVDLHYFAKKMTSLWYCEQNEDLANIVAHNAKTLGDGNLHFKQGNGIEILKTLDQQFDWLYVDPSRRSQNRQKVFLLKDCSPNVQTFQRLFLKYARNALIKTSPLLDLKKTLQDLKNVKAVHIVAVNNEVKELLWHLERDFSDSPLIRTINLNKRKDQTFEFQMSEISNAKASLASPIHYLYEPNSAVLKSGAFDLIPQKFDVFKLHKHSHLYTSENLVEFPGRRFIIDKVLPFNKKEFAKEGIRKANITTRNFPISVSDIRKKLKVKDGGDLYLFFTTLQDGKKYIIICSKI
jgi:hypothetical protein